MGSSCTTAKKSSAKKGSQVNKYQVNSAKSDNKNSNFAIKKGNVSKEAFEECFMRNNKNANASALVSKPSQQTNNMYSSKNQQTTIGDDHQINHKEISPQSTNVPHMLSCNTSLKFESPKTSQNGQKTSPNLSRRKISYIEIFILERKRYMQEKGVFNYTPYTVLPAPKLKKLANNSLFKKRKSSLAHIPSDVFSNDNAAAATCVNTATKTNHTGTFNSFGSHTNEFGTFRKDITPAQMPKGDCDIIKIEV